MSKQDASDRSYNAVLRLARQLSDLRELVTECSERVTLNSDNEDWESIIWSAKREIEDAEFMAKEAGKQFAEFESRIAKAAADLSIDRPADHLTWSRMTIDAAWQTIRKMKRICQSQQDAKHSTEVLATFAESPFLEKFDDVESVCRFITLEFRADAALANEQKLISTADAELQLRLTRTTRPNLPRWAKALGIERPKRGFYRQSDIDLIARKYGKDVSG